MNKKVYSLIKCMLMLAALVLVLTRDAELQHEEDLSGLIVIKQDVERTVGKDSLQEKGSLNESVASEFTNSDGIRILFLGIDRTEESEIEIGVFRTDAIALVNIDTDSKEIKVLRIPRDTYVYIPRIGKMDKINHAYVWGGMEEKGISSTIETVNNFVKYTKVENYFTIDLEPVPEIVDKLGGVDMEVDVDMNTHGFNLSKGFQHLDGEKAYQFISWRYSGEGEIDRIRRQQKLIGAMLVKLKENKNLTSILEIIIKYNKSIKTNMNLPQLFQLIRLAAVLDYDTIEYSIIPGEGQMIDGIWYMIPDKEKTENILKDYFQ